MSKSILVTGGAGYIGSHTLISLIENGYQPIVVDNFTNSSPSSLRRIKKITGRNIKSYELDASDADALQEVFSENEIDSVIHFAGLKAVGESIEQPLLYYRNNIDSTLSLLEVMDEHDVTKLVFSSSATVYSPAASSPLKETAALGPINPYGQTKLMIEQILRDLAVSSDKWQFNLLRYFNPIGAHPSGLIGEDPTGPPNNLLPYVSQVAIGRRKQLSVFGDDYDTPDGTGVRDYLHVMDLAEGHVSALEHLPSSGVDEFNLGTGRGTSVLELVAAFESASGEKVPYEVVDRRPGDIATVFADPKKAKDKLDWQAKRSVKEACEDAWSWQGKNPEGYSPE